MQKRKAHKVYDNPKHLGFIRFWQVYFGLDIAVNILALVLFVKSSYHFDFEDYVDFSEVVCYGILFWLIYQRKRITKYVVLIVSAVVLGVSFVGYSLLKGQPDFDFLLNPFVWVRVLAVVYFMTSRRVRAQLVQPFTFKPAQSVRAEHERLWQPKTWGFWRNLIIYFCVFSIIGHWLEALYCTFIRLGILSGTYDPNSQIWIDWLYPFVVYGIGAVACILLLYPIKNWLLSKTHNIVTTLIFSFVLNTLVCTSIELMMGLLLNQPDAAGNLPLWDYRNMAFNFMGQICLQNALAFGLVSTLMVWVFYPILERLLAHFSNDVMQVVFVAIVVFFSILMALYCIKYVVLSTADSP
ncbi:MAG: putative ABC transporter permease [Coriobacteriales bacterium]|nr:putative ABC transporter permease [Coriobacteriales bacterium]